MVSALSEVLIRAEDTEKQKCQLKICCAKRGTNGQQATAREKRPKPIGKLRVLRRLAKLYVRLHSILTVKIIPENGREIKMRRACNKVVADYIQPDYEKVEKWPATTCRCASEQKPHWRNRKSSVQEVLR